jgi:hypothetical protein
VVVCDTSVLELIKASVAGAQAVVTPPTGICIDALTGFSITTTPVKVQDGALVINCIIKVSIAAA